MPSPGVAAFTLWPRPAARVYRQNRMDTVTAVPRPAPDAEELYRRWIQFLDDEFTRHQSAERRSEIVRDQLYQLYLGRPHAPRSSVTLTSELPSTVLELSLDPHNVTIDAESFSGLDQAKFQPRKPLLWFWKMFDRSPIGLNLWLGVRFRAMLGRHIFASIGKGVRFHHAVELTVGYNLSLGDGVVVRQGALLNDRGGITIGASAIVGSFARVFSHAHDTVNYELVTNKPTFIGAGARIASHYAVMGGQQVPEGVTLGNFPMDEHL